MKKSTRFTTQVNLSAGVMGTGLVRGERRVVSWNLYRAMGQESERVMGTGELHVGQ